MRDRFSKRDGQMSLWDKLVMKQLILEQQRDLPGSVVSDDITSKWLRGQPVENIDNLWRGAERGKEVHSEVGKPHDKT